MTNSHHLSSSALHPQQSAIVQYHTHIEPQPEYLRIDEFPGLTENSLKNAAKRGEIKLYKPRGVKVALVRVTDVHQWIQRSPLTADPAPPVAEPADEVDLALSAGGLATATPKPGPRKGRR